MSIKNTSLEKHDGDATCIVSHNGYIFSSGADGKVKIWDENINFIKTITMHESFIYVIAINSKGKIYSSGCEGSVKYVQNPLESNDVQELMTSDYDIILSMITIGETLYTGDDKGCVTKWENDKITFKYNLIEEIKCLAVEQNLIYTVRDWDAVVSEVVSIKTGRYVNKATIPGRAPLTLLGPLENEKRKYLAFATRDGKGLILIKNQLGEHYATVWTKTDCHNMIINSICGTDKYLFSAGYDGSVKRWSNLNDTNPMFSGDVNIGSCINFICNGFNNDIYVASSDGLVRCIQFT